MNDIPPHPSWTQAQQDVATLRAQLTQALLDRDELRHVIGKDLETAYIMIFGPLEHEAGQARYALLRLQRKITLVQTTLRRQEMPDEEAIERQLDDEFAAARHKLDEQIERMNAALAWHAAPALADSERKRLEQLYRELVTALHPALNPDLGKTEQQLFRQAVEAHKNRDLRAMRHIGATIGAALQDASREAPARVEDIIREQERLQRMTRMVERDTAKIRRRFPYTVRDLLQTPLLIQHKKRLLQERIDSDQCMFDVYNKLLSQEIFLFDTHVAGTTHIPDIETLDPELHPGDRLDFFREPGNEHDDKAIVIKTAAGAKIGYVPRRDNLVFARLMDAGKKLFGRISAKAWQGTWLKIDIKIYLQE